MTAAHVTHPTSLTGLPDFAELAELTVRVGESVLVDRVSLRVPPGRVTALVGASGSGKTTTGLALLGEYPPGAEVSGDVTVPEGLVGYVPQHPAAVLNPARRVDALLRDLARAQTRALPRPERRTAAHHLIRTALHSAQLPDGETLLHRYPHQLSGGQQQRVVLAQALLLGARIVIADEPTTGQDPLTKRGLVDQLKHLAQRGLGVLLLSHDLDVVRELADEVHVLRAGQLVESGTPERLWHTPHHPWTRELLAPTPHFTTPPPPPSPHPPLLQIRDLVARHHGVPVLHLPRLDLATGECLAVVGRSGSGKTTLGRCLAGLHRDHSGEVRLAGDAPLPRSLRARTREQLAAVQYVFQDARAAFDEYRPVLDQVARTAVRLRGATPSDATTEALHTLAELGLTEPLVRRHPTQLSGGELQRAALARALLAHPSLLICDEVTSGLDTVTRRTLLTVLTQLPRTHTKLTLILITHDPETAALAHHQLTLAQGKPTPQAPTSTSTPTDTDTDTDTEA